MYKIIFLYLIVINICGFLIMFIDKNRAVHKEWRIPEKTLMFLSLIGGSIGMFAGMHIFRHKTKHIKFTLGVPFIFIIELITAVYLIK
ncbi:DUF1294 domain-containing protein [Clostridium butyricum]|uniref:DUF1294 domain-containing protein n=1 Tax=Clostridium butyricum TaxID=1492 RepID=UPI0003D60DFD|nr:DUF1294 domain-containing protein [Clostridium butyricum]ETI88666.1 MAG: Phosphoesterase [Clostridium butyricum DORA_1]MBZ0313399.1 DUF1294 domain-containing protein [Clostridium butyricum]MDU1508918.1 DUF1294 domain-containing protein [Clostridium butyricum]MDU4802276.1 DUF1294 domain-containing protein [Clostridium butyricum]